MRNIVSWAAASLLAAGSCSPAAAREPLGAEFLVNTTTAGAQGVAEPGQGVVVPLAIAARDDGGFVVVWNQQQRFAGDGSPSVSGGVFAQRYNAGGGAEGAEFRVFPGESRSVDIAMAPDGAFVVVGIDPIFSHIQAQRYTASGTAAGSAINVSDGPFGPGPVCARENYRFPQVAIQADGAFAVVWTCLAAGTHYGRYYDGDGFALSNIVPLGNFESHGFLAGLHSEVLMHASGYLVIAEGPCRIEPGSDVYSAPCAQVFNAAGQSQGNMIPLGLQQAFGTIGSQRPQGARDADGNFALVWNQSLRDGESVDHFRVVARTFNSAGAPLGDRFEFPETDVLRNVPHVAAGGTGDARRFVLSFERAIPGDPDNRSEVVAREFLLNMVSPDGNFRPHADTTFHNHHPAVAVDGSGNYAIAWTSDRDAGTNPDVYARRYGTPPPPEVGRLEFVSPTFEVAEGIGTAMIGVERVGGSSGAASVRVDSIAGSATIGTDYDHPVGGITLDWGDGEEGVKFAAITIAQDTTDEANELFGLDLDDAVGAAIGAPFQAAVAILDDDAPPTAQFAAATSVTAEGGQAVTLSVSLSAASGKEISLAYALGGSAQLTQDYTVSPASPVIIPVGATGAEIIVTPVDDAAEEGDESILVDLDFGNSLNVAAGTSTRHTVTLGASDTVVTADLAASLAPALTTIRTDRTTVVQVTVTNLGPHFASGVTSQLRLLDGGRIANFPQTLAGISCTLSNLDRNLSCNIDGVGVGVPHTYPVIIEPPVEPGTFRLQHSVFGGPGDPQPGNDTVTATLTARLPNPGVVAFELPSAPAAFEEFERLELTLARVVRSADGEGPASVAFRARGIGTAPATAGSDFDFATQGRLVFGDGVRTATVVYELLPDDLAEDVEAFEIELFDPQGTTLDPQRSVFPVLILDTDGGTGDTRPEPFALSDAPDGAPASGAAAGAAVDSAPVTVSGIGGDAPISVANVAGPGALALDRTARATPAAAPQYRINGGAFTSAAGVVRNGDTVVVRTFASRTPGGRVTTRLTIGGESATIGVTTAGVARVELPPPAFSYNGGATGAPLLLALYASFLWRARRLTPGSEPVRRRKSSSYSR